MSFPLDVLGFVGSSDLGGDQAQSSCQQLESQAQGREEEKLYWPVKERLESCFWKTAAVFVSCC